MSKLSRFNQDNPHFSAFRALSLSVMVALTRARFAGDKMRMQTADFEMDTIGSHSHMGSQALDEVRHRLVDVFSWQLLPDGLHARRLSTHPSS